jgi:hypothetical protein
MARQKLAGLGTFRLFLLGIYRLHDPPCGGGSRFLKEDHMSTIAILSRT